MELEMLSRIGSTNSDPQTDAITCDSLVSRDQISCENTKTIKNDSYFGEPGWLKKQILKR